MKTLSINAPQPLDAAALDDVVGGARAKQAPQLPPRPRPQPDAGLTTCASRSVEGYPSENDGCGWYRGR